MIDLKETVLTIHPSFYSDNLSVSIVYDDNGQNVLQIDGTKINLDEKQNCYKMSCVGEEKKYSAAEFWFEIDFIEEFKKVIENKTGIKIDKVIVNEDDEKSKYKRSLPDSEKE